MRHLIENVVDATLRALHARGELKQPSAAYSVDPPKQAAHGDLSCNVAMVVAKGEGKPPRAIAEAIVKGLVDEAGVVAKIDVAGPGFLNFTLKDEAITRVARDVLAAGPAWGRAAARTGKKVMIEFVSANPTGPLHVGHARGAFVGDACARLLDAAGHDVVREYYINDAGLQVETLGRSVYTRYRQLFGEEVTLQEGQYPAEYVVDIAKALRDEVGDSLRHQPEEAWLPKAIAVGIRENMAAIRATLARCGVSFDVFSSEAALHASGAVHAVVDEYKAKGVTYDADHARGTEDKVRREGSKAATFSDRQQGGTFLTTSAHGDDEDRIVLRRDGTPVYLTADLAYHRAKFARGFDRMIDVWGADHAGHVPRIRAGMKLLDYDAAKLEFLLVQIVRLVRDGAPVKQSKRAGNVYELTDLIDDVGADAARIIFLSKAPTTQFEFDLGVLAKQSSENPVFYVQYGHARCSALLARAAREGQPFRPEALDEVVLAKLKLPEERAILKKLATLPDVVAGAAQALEPHRVFHFVVDLIGDFHSYYTKYGKSERVISDDATTTQARLALVAALQTTLKSALGLLGATAPDHMEAPGEEPAG